MARSSVSSKTLWQYSHSISILFAVLLFTAGFLCVLLWTNNFVHTPTSASGPGVSTFTGLSPAVQTFSITYQTAIFGAAWNAVLFVIMLILERDVAILETDRIRYEVEKAACIVSVVGNAIYSVACIALTATLARLAAEATIPSGVSDRALADQLKASQYDRRAGQGVTAAMAGLAALTAWWACVMDILHAQDSRHRRFTKSQPLGVMDESIKQA